MDNSFILSTLLPYLLVFLGVVSVVLFIVLLVLFLLVMFHRNFAGRLGQRLGFSEKNRTLTFLGLGIGGILAALQVVALAGAVSEQARANEKTEQGHRQERLKNAIEHLGHASDSVRLGGAYELIHLAIDTKNLRWTIWGMLCDHIRLTTSPVGRVSRRRNPTAHLPLSDYAPLIRPTHLPARWIPGQARNDERATARRNPGCIQRRTDTRSRDSEGTWRVARQGHLV